MGNVRPNPWGAMTDIARTILDRLTADDSPQRLALAGLVVDHALDLPLRTLADPDEVLDALLAAVTVPNLERTLDRHVRPARARRQARWRESGERAGDLIPAPAAARIETLLSRSRNPRVEWAHGAIDPADVRALLAPALQQVLLGFVERIAAMTPKVPRPDPRPPSRFGIRDRIKANIKERSEQIVDAGKSVLEGVGLDFRERLEETAREFGESASGVLRKGVEKRLESEEGQQILARMRVQLFRRLQDTALSDLAGGDEDESEVGLIVAQILAHNACREEVRTALRGELSALLTLEGDRSVRALLEEAGTLALVRDPLARRAADLSRGLFASAPFQTWLTELVNP